MQSIRQQEPFTLQDLIRANLSFSFYLILATTGMLCLFASAVSALPTVLSKIYLLSIAGYYAGGLFLANLVLLPVRLSKYTRWLAPVLAWAWLLYLAVDYGTFNLYEFHINPLLLEMFITNPNGFGVPLLVQLVCIAAAGGFGLGVYCLNRLAYKTNHRWYWFKSGLMLLIIPMITANCLIHVWANYYDREEITRIDALFPIYYPLTSHQSGQKLSAAFPSIFPAQRGQRLNLSLNAGGDIRYPVAPLTFKPQTALPSLLMIVLESWQKDTLKPEIMPHLTEFSTKATRFEQHLSGGSTTVPGLFSLMFGLHSSYYDRFKGSPRSNPSQFTEKLQELGYRSRVFTSNHLDRFALRSLFFSQVADEDYCSQVDDQVLVNEYLANLDSSIADDQPRVDFVFLTASHSPYQYPPQYAKFQPLPLVEGGFAFNKSADAIPYRNDYYNSLHYSDALLKQILDKLQSQGRLDNTWVVITGDHAEEFNENGLGFWGHGSNFTVWQTAVPLVVRSPGQQVGKIESRLSLHQDLVPTLMTEALGCENPSGHYANGTNLFRLPERRGTVLTSYFTKAYLIDGVVVECLTGKKYAWNDMKRAGKLGDIQNIKIVMEQERQFLR